MPNPQTDDRTVPVQLRVPKGQRDLIDRAARAAGKTRTNFILEAATREAEDVILDQRLFRIEERSFTEFLAILDAPVSDNLQLRAFMTRRPRWTK